MGRAEPLTLEEIRPTFTRLLTGPLALAVSGGGDSMALMHLVAQWVAEPGTTDAQGMGPLPLRVLTVDHALRAESADEAAWVEQEAQKLRLPHTTFVWRDAKPATGIQAAAREARYRLINQFLQQEVQAGWPKRSLVTAHHADDQAETFLMRLARGSGLDGLSGMREEERIMPTTPDAEPGAALRLLRPVLHVPKARLIAALEAQGRAWREDPSNRSEAFERVRMRKALDLLSDAGIGTAHIALSARRLERARAATLLAVRDVARRMTHHHGGLYGEIDAQLLTDYPEEHRVRIFAAMLAAHGGVAPRARLSQIEALTADMGAPMPIAASSERRSTTLGGCRIEREGDGPVYVWREMGRDGPSELDLQPGMQRIWDGRFRVGLAAEAAAPVLVRALGADGLRGIGREMLPPDPVCGKSAPPGAAETMPSFWRNGRLLAVPGLLWPIGPPSGCWASFVAEDTLDAGG